MKWRCVQIILWGIFFVVFASGCSAKENAKIRDAVTCEQADCEAKHRGCSRTAGVAKCTACQAGYVDVGGSCAAAMQCEELQCEKQDRGCEEAAANADAHCVGCMEGFVERGGACVAGG